MTERLPLLMFPQAEISIPPKGKGTPLGKPHVPEHEKQVMRLGAQLTSLQQDFERYKASISGSVAGLEPETVLVIEIAGTVNEFRQAIEAIGLEWMGEWDVDDIPPDEDFFECNKKGERANKAVKGQMFLSLGNEAGMREILSLWEQWKNDQKLPRGRAKWCDVFSQTVQIRRWGMEEALRETGMLERWQDLLNPVDPVEKVRFQIELFYRRSENKRKQSERNVAALLEAAGGRMLGSFIDMPEIAFHAVKAELPAERIRQLLNDLESENYDTDIQLFKFHGVMYFRPTGQSLAVSGDGEGVDTEIAEETPELLPPVVAVLDGVPNVQHPALKNRLWLDDPDNLSALYQPGERKHGTAMASLVVRGDLADGQSVPLARWVYMLPVMQPDPLSDPRNRIEHIPDHVFFEDRIARAVRRMFEGEGNVPAQAPDVCVINLSIGDPARPFIHTPSPWARLLDWLSWKYRVLFCVSAGNYTDDIDIGLPQPAYQALTDRKKTEHMLKCMQKGLSERRILSPAEAINAITVGATHADNSGNNYYQGQRTDLLPCTSLPSPAARLGYGFRRSVKPEILMQGGRQLYRTPALDSQTDYKLYYGDDEPGLRVAWDSKQAGELSKEAHTRGTSNATALATHSAARIYEMLDSLRAEHEKDIPQELMSVLIKALLVHGATQDDGACEAIKAALKTQENSRKLKEIIARYLGYGEVQIERVLACTGQRGTVLGFGEIREDEVHKYRLPLPPDLSGSKEWRRMVLTLAWFTPVNPNHRNFREAKLKISPEKGERWKDLSLKLENRDGDQHQVLRGTVQHEVLEGSKQIAAFQDGDSISLHISCKKDATARLDEAIPYGLAVTLEVAEGAQIPIYNQLRERLPQKVAAGMAGGTL